jgi:hypothetical protein
LIFDGQDDLRAWGSADGQRELVLIRRPGETAQADPDEIRAMEDRFIAPAIASRRRERLEKTGDASAKCGRSSKILMWPLID